MARHCGESRVKSRRLSKPIGILSALSEEIQLLLHDMRNSSRQRIAGTDYGTGYLKSKRVVIASSGWGKVAAALSATALILHYGVRSVILIGVAGAARKNLRIGDIIIAKSLVQYDLDARPIFSKHVVPNLGKAQLETSPVLRKAALVAARKFARALPAEGVPEHIARLFETRPPRVFEGIVATGDTFVGDLRTLCRIRTSVGGVYCVEMEGAAVAQVCTAFHIPFVVVRVISDKAGADAREEFSASISDMAGYFSQGIISNLLPAI